MDKMRMESVNMTTPNIKKIMSTFPNCITKAVDENGKSKKVINVASGPAKINVTEIFKLFASDIRAKVL